jgi:hypothetical protein
MHIIRWRMLSLKTKTTNPAIAATTFLGVELPRKSVVSARKIVYIDSGYLDANMHLSGIYVCGQSNNTSKRSLNKWATF